MTSAAPLPQGLLEKAVETLARDWARMVTFSCFPTDHWTHLRPSNPVESSFSAVRLRPAAAKRHKKVANAEALIGNILLIAEKKFRLTWPHRANIAIVKHPAVGAGRRRWRWELGSEESQRVPSPSES